MIIDTTLVQRLITAQFPQWKDLQIKPVHRGGWDNRTFHLGKHMSVRLPSAEAYASKVEIEQYWLPKLSPHLPLPIPVPIAMGEPGEGYPWKWSIYRWIEGQTAAAEHIKDLTQFAIDLATFLKALQHCDTTGAPMGGPHNFYRGEEIAIYDDQTRQAINILTGKIDVVAVTAMWDQVLLTKWQFSPVWIHGDVAVGNLLVRDGRLSAVIDFGGMGIGDPACDLIMAWTLFQDESREAFRTSLALDQDTWMRGRGWALWKALIVAAGLIKSTPVEAAASWRIIDAILKNYYREKR
jgi:aminoglycoside phosphotransferase (APT) family kinase protein